MPCGITLYCKKVTQVNPADPKGSGNQKQVQATESWSGRLGLGVITSIRISANVTYQIWVQAIGRYFKQLEGYIIDICMKIIRWRLPRPDDRKIF